MTKAKLTGLILFAAILAAAPIAPAAQDPQSFLLSSVSVKGTRRYQSSAVAAAAGLKIGQTISIANLKAAANRLASIGVFNRVGYNYRTHEKGMSVVFTVQDSPSLLPCIFENFVWFSRKDLIQQLSSRVPLFRGYAPPSGAMIDRISAALDAMLASRGIQARVQGVPEAALGSPIRTILFEEVGVPVPIRKVEFSGVTKLYQAQLEAAAHPLLGQNYYASFVAGFSRDTLGDVYRKQGYLRAAFGQPVPTVLKSDPTPNAVAVTISVTAGEQYRLKTVGWTGEGVILHKELAKSLHLEEGKLVNELELQKDLRAMAQLLHSKGYAAANVKAVPTFDEAAGTVSYQIQVHQGPLFRMGKLEIVGLPPNLAATVARVSPLRPGDIYDFGVILAGIPRNAIPLLPPGQGRWKIMFRQIAHRSTRTVDVVATFSHSALPAR